MNKPHIRNCIICEKEFESRNKAQKYCNVLCRFNGEGLKFESPSKNLLRFAIFARDNFRCVYCGISAREYELQVDHILPVIEGGCDTVENVVTSCMKCNSSKGHFILKPVTIVKLWHEAFSASSKDLIGLFKQWNKSGKKIR